MTGSNGTLGSVLKNYLQSFGCRVNIWDYNQATTDDYWKMYEFIKKIKPDILIHLAAITSFSESERVNSWQVNYLWSSELAWICRELKIKFIFTSTNLVFKKNGPYFPDTEPDSDFGYGYEKRAAENKILNQNPCSVIIRLGWQISISGNNSMLMWLDREFEKKGCINASFNWYPSCSYTEDTSRLIHHLFDFEGGIYQINSNQHSHFHEICCNLQRKYNRNWKLIATDDDFIDQRMYDDRIPAYLLNSF